MKTAGPTEYGRCYSRIAASKEKQTAQVRWPHTCHIQPLGMLFENPHRENYPGTEAFFRSVTAALESLARFDPPGSDRGTPTPSVPELAWCGARPCRGRCRPAVFFRCRTVPLPALLCYKFLHKQIESVHNRGIYASLVVQRTEHTRCCGQLFAKLLFSE